MPLPYSYRSKFEIKNTENFELKKIIEHSYYSLKNKKNIETNNNTITFDEDSAFIKFNYSVNLNFLKKDNIVIEYEFMLENLIKITIILILIIAFFSSLSMTGFLWFSFIISVLFFTINIIFIDNYIQKTIKSLPVYNLSNPDNDEKLTEEQEKWMIDKSKCSGCGETITEYDYICHECGLKTENRIKTTPYNITKYQKQRVKYHYKDKK